MSKAVDYEYLVTAPPGPGSLISVVLAGLGNRVLFAPIAADERQLPSVLPAVPNPIVAGMYTEAREWLLEHVQAVPAWQRVQAGLSLRRDGLWCADHAGTSMLRRHTAWSPVPEQAPWYAGFWRVEAPVLNGIANIQQTEAVRAREIEVGRAGRRTIAARVRTQDVLVHRVVQIAPGSWGAEEAAQSMVSPSVDSVQRTFEPDGCRIDVRISGELFQAWYPEKSAAGSTGSVRRKQWWTLTGALARGSAWWYDATVGNRYGSIDFGLL